MSIQTNLQGRLRNTSLPKSHAMSPIFESVINSIHAIEEKGDPISNGLITLEIIRSSQAQLPTSTGDAEVDNIIGFAITDNGIGFNDTNMESFQTLDSPHKIAKGCRGVGRLLWLKAFRTIHVSSIFKDDEGALHKRAFTFDAQYGVRMSEDIGVTHGDIQTCIHLDGFYKIYQKSAPKRCDTISNALLEHCLWYFVRDEGAPTINIKDGVEQVNLNQLYNEYLHSSAFTEKIDIKGTEFTLTHLKFRVSSNKKHALSLCAAGRLVTEEQLTSKSLPGLYGKMNDTQSDFVYSCYVASPFLDENVRAERTSFDISDDTSIDSSDTGTLFDNNEISSKDIRNAVIERAKEYLSQHLEVNVEAGIERVTNFISEKAPRYRPLMSRISKQDLTVDPSINDRDLELHLHKHLTDIERELINKGHTIMLLPEEDDFKDYEKRLNDYLALVKDIKQSDLANYVSHRRVILDLLEKAILRLESGKYVKEDVIHKLIMPMGKTSNDISFDESNLWLIDERLAFHNYLASDKTLKSMPITGSDSTKEPDICALNVYDNPMLMSDKQSPPLASIIVIEIKRPMRNDAKEGEDKNPIEQSLNYINRIREGKVRTANGRPIPNSDDIPGFCYIICDLTDSMVERCKLATLRATSDHMGYFGYNENYKAYIEVISYNRLVNMAKERNRAFFDKLGLPSG